MRRKSVITVGTGDFEVKIYTIRRNPSFQCAWHDLGSRKTKAFAKLDASWPSMRAR